MSEDNPDILEQNRRFLAQEDKYGALHFIKAPYKSSDRSISAN